MIVNSRLEHALRGVRFQPIYSVQDNSIESWEVLGELYPGIDCENFFNTLSLSASFKVLCWQLDIIAALEKPKNIFINIPAKVLCNPVMVKRIASRLHSGIALEVHDPDNFIQLTPKERSVFEAMRKIIKNTGSHLWLDDVNTEHLLLLGKDISTFDGVKIDKETLWQNRNTPWLFNSLITCCAFMVDKVLIEGVQNQDYFEFARNSGGHLLQGFFWPEERLNICYSSVM